MSFLLAGTGGSVSTIFEYIFGESNGKKKKKKRIYVIFKALFLFNESLALLLLRCINTCVLVSVGILRSTQPLSWGVGLKRMTSSLVTALNKSLAYPQHELFQGSGEM